MDAPRVGSRVELPPHLQGRHRQAVRLEWWTLAFFVVTIVLVGLVAGQSQAMKAAWIEDMLALLPPIAFLVAARYRDRAPDDRFPYGYHRASIIAYLSSALALLVFGSFITYDSAMTLIKQERPSIGMIEVFGVQLWLGWLMIGVLAWSAIPAVVLGRLKLPLARDLHDKVLYADSDMNKADWLTAGAGILGILGIGAGLWWADAVAALVISVDIVRDGVGNVRNAVADLMDARPTTYDHSRPHPLPDEVAAEVAGWPWVADRAVRLRESGHVLVGEVLVVPRPGTTDVTRRCSEGGQRLQEMDWRLHDVVVSPVLSLRAAGDESGEHPADVSSPPRGG